MDDWTPVHLTRPQYGIPGSWTLAEPRNNLRRSLELRIARMEPVYLAPAVLPCLLLYSPFTAVWGRFGFLLTMLLGILTPLIVHVHLKSQARAALGPSWRITHLSAGNFRALPESYGLLVYEMTLSLHGMWTSRAARAHWLAAEKLRDAHSAVWQASLLLLNTAEQHDLVRESAQFEQLSALVEVKAAELADTEAVVRDVAAQLREAYTKVIELDTVILAEEERVGREQRIAELERRLTDNTGRLPLRSMPPVWQDALDAINAHVEGALSVLSIDRR